MSLSIVEHYGLWCIFLGLKEWWSAIQIGSISFVMVLLEYSEHLHLPLGKQSPVQISVYSYQDPFCSPPVLPALASLASCKRVLTPGNLPHSHLQSLSFLMADRTVLCILCFKVYQRNMCRFSPSLHCFSAPMSTHLINTGGHLKQAHRDNCLLIPITFQTWKGFLMMGVDTFYFTATLRFP